MAYTSIHSIKATVSAAISYITDDDKTIDGLYVQSYACRADSRGAAEDFRTIKETGTGRTQILAHHIIQSFAPDEVTPEQALQIGEELCDRLLQGDYQYVLAVHSDKSHIHCHIIFNNTNLYNGLSFTTEHNQGKKNERAWAQLRAISDELCKEHGISVIEPKNKGVSHFERDMQIQDKSWKDKLRAKIAEVMLYSRDFKDFLQKCTEYGIEYVYKPSNKVKLKFRLKDEGQQKFTRADTLGADFTPERIAEQIAEIQKAQAVKNRLAEKKNPKKAVAPPKSTVTPKAKPKSEYVYKPPTDEEFFKVFGVHFDEVDKLKEIKPAEKKKNVWAEVRGMRGADKMIADLETSGISSLDDLKSFFWNVHHADDHTNDLAALEKKIKGIDKLIAKIKHLDELAPIYKEYQSLSGFKQSRYKKKHTAEIEDFEKTRAYIKEHIKDYYVDGKQPKRSELEQMLIDLKMEYNALVPEHNAFLKKKAAAAPYTKAVRTYLEKQHQQERDRQYQERKRSQQRKKDTLE